MMNQTVTFEQLYDNRIVDNTANTTTPKANRYQAKTGALTLFRRGHDVSLEVRVNGKWVADEEGMKQFNTEKAKPATNGNKSVAPAITTKTHLSNLIRATQSIRSKTSVSDGDKSLYAQAIAAVVVALDINLEELDTLVEDMMTDDAPEDDGEEDEANEE